MADPRLLLLDEPTVGMDVDARRAFWATMGGLAHDGRTVLFATHYLDEADEFADRIVVLNQGRGIADGTGREIKAIVGGRRISFARAAPPIPSPCPRGHPQPAGGPHRGAHQRLRRHAARPARRPVRP